MSCIKCSSKVDEVEEQDQLEEEEEGEKPRLKYLIETQDTSSSDSERSVASVDNQVPEKYSFQKYSVFWYFPLTMMWIVVFPFGPLCYHHTPHTNLRSEELQHMNEFLGYRAENFVKEYTSLGSRWFAHFEFWHAHEYLRNRIDEIIRDSYHENLRFEVDVDTLNDSIYRNGLLYDFKDFVNIAVKLSPMNSSETHYPTLLLTANYDSFYTSPGAGDATVIGVFLEIIRVFFLMNPEKTQNYNATIIFLFIGAGYNFRTPIVHFTETHRWSQNISAFISFESFASGGRELLIRYTKNNAWLLRCYKQVSFPFGFDIFNYLRVHYYKVYGDKRTFDIFEEETDSPGIEFALVEDGYAIQTKYDTFHRVANDTCQTLGENLIGLIENIVIAEEFRNKTSRKKEDATYSSILGVYFHIESGSGEIVFTLVTAGWCFICVSVSVIHKADFLEISVIEMMKKVGALFALKATCIGIVIAVNQLTSVLLDSLVHPLTYYKDNYFFWGLYVVNSMMAEAAVITMFLEYYRGNFLPIKLSVKFLLHCQAVLICLFVITALIMQLRCLFFTFSIFIYNISLTLNILTRSVRHFPIVGKYLFHENAWIFIHCFCQLANIVIYGHIAYSALVVSIPLLGMLGPLQNPDDLMCWIGFIINFLMTGFLVPIYQLCSYSKFVLKAYPATVVLLFVIAIEKPPFSREIPQKFLVRHTQRIYYANGIKEFNDSGFLLIPLDRRLYQAKDSVKNYSMSTSIHGDCLHDFEKKFEFCRMPIYDPNEFSMGFHYIPGAAPQKTSPDLKIHSISQKTYEETKMKVYKFIIEGPHVILLNIIPAWNANLTRWNLKPQIWEIVDFKPPYLVHLSYADRQVNHTLELYFQKDPVHDLSNTFALIAIGHFFATPKDHNAEFTSFRGQFPDYVLLKSWTTKLQIYEYQ